MTGSLRIMALRCGVLKLHSLTHEVRLAAGRAIVTNTVETNDEGVTGAAPVDAQNAPTSRLGPHKTRFPTPPTALVSLAEESANQDYLRLKLLLLARL